MINILKKSTLIVLLFTAFFSTACSKSDWVAKINGDVISKKEFDSIYYAQMRTIFQDKSNEEIDKQTKNDRRFSKEDFLNQLIRQRLIYNKAESDDITDNEELKTLKELQKKAIIVTLFTQKKFKDKVNVTPAEIEKFYKKERRNFKGQPIKKAERFIRRQLIMQKFQKLAKDYVDNLKESSSIEKNNKILEKLSAADKSKKPTEGWVAKINGEEISVKEFETNFYTQNQQLYRTSKEEIDKLAADSAAVRRNPLLNKANFLEQEISQRLVYAAAEKENIFDDSDTNALIKAQIENLVVLFYIRENFKDEIKATEKEIENAYMQQKSRLKGVPFTKASIFLKQQIEEQKMRRKHVELINSLRDKSMIERNPDAFKTKTEEKK